MYNGILLIICDFDCSRNQLVHTQSVSEMKNYKCIDDFNSTSNWY